MLGAIALGLLQAVCESDSNDAARQASENERAISAEKNETQIKLEKERTKQQIIGGIFDLLNACASEAGGQNSTQSSSKGGK